METVTRRSLITGLTAFIAAPAIVRAPSLMPVKSILEIQELEWTKHKTQNTIAYRVTYCMPDEEKIIIERVRKAA